MLKKVKLNKIKNAEIIKHKRRTTQHKELLNLFNDLLDIILNDKTLESESPEDEFKNENEKVESKKEENENEKVESRKEKNENVENRKEENENENEDDYWENEDENDDDDDYDYENKDEVETMSQN